MVKWDYYKICDIFDVITGTTPATSIDSNWSNGSINWFTPTDLSQLNSAYISESQRKITKTAFEKSSLTLMPKRSLLLSTRAPVGYVALLINDATFNQGCKGLIPRKEYDINPEFYYYYLIYKRHELEMLSAGSTFKELSKERLDNYTVPHPPLPVQRKIAEILGAADAAIEKVDQAISKTERLKKGLIQQLLTKGIGHTQFKNTELGRIPKEWEVVRLGELGTLQYGYTETSTTVNTGCKYLRITDIESTGIVNWASVPFCKIDENDYDKYNLEKGDLLFARIGSTTGKSCFIDKNIKGVFASYLIRFRPTVAVNQKYLFYYSQTVFYWNQANKNKEGQLKKGINAPILKSIKIILPSVAEQNKIVAGIDSFNDKLAILRKKRYTLRTIKQSLMSDLLSGKRSVKI